MRMISSSSNHCQQFDPNKINVGMLLSLNITSRHEALGLNSSTSSGMPGILNKVDITAAAASYFLEGRGGTSLQELIVSFIDDVCKGGRMYASHLDSPLPTLLAEDS